ncbi:MAG: DUF2306 domain-containing protein [Henriciella sp.]|jgi:uncharacterized membrane protein|nr:DUF2306 domain-containing protein [Henriciella sp.]
MADIATKRSPLGILKKVPGWVWTISIASIIYLIVSFFILRANPSLDPQFRISLEPLQASSIATQIHVAAALLSFSIGAFLLIAPKGFRLHKTFGWVWVTSMSVTAISSFFLTGLMGSSYSPIHALSAWTMIGLPFGIAAIRRKQVQKHRKTMTGMFFGAMVIAGMFSFLPGRLMWHIFFAV